MSSSYPEDTPAAPSVVRLAPGAPDDPGTDLRHRPGTHETPGAGDVRAVVEEACRRLAHTTDPITGESRLIQDLGFDSLRRLELAVVLESYFDLGELDMDRALSLATVGDVVDLVSTVYRQESRR